MNSAPDVTEVAKAALEAAKAAGATATEQVAAAAVAASDVAKKQGANAEQAAEVAVAAVLCPHYLPHKLFGSIFTSCVGLFSMIWLAAR